MQESPGTDGRWAEDLYDRLANEEDARVCKDISDAACRDVPGNFLKIVGASILTKTGDALVNPKTVLAWLVQFVGAPASVLALLVPIRESGSLIPQLAIAAWVRRRPVRKWIWVLGAVLQGASVAAIGAASLMLRGAQAGIAILSLLALFSLARGLCSVSSKDVLGKTIPRTRRGRVSGIAAGASGIFVVAAGTAVFLARDTGSGFYAGLLFGASALWWLAALLYASIDEEAGETGGGGNAIAVAVESVALLGRDRGFRRFVLTRALLISSALTAPYYVALAQKSAGGATSTLGLVVVAGGLASSLSAPTWGRLADRSSRSVLVVAATVTGLLGIAVFAIERIGSGAVPTWVYPAAFLVLGVAHAGVRLGRKTYIVDMARGNRRTDYVAVSNTLIGVILLVAGGITATLSFLPAETMVLILAVTALVGAVCGLGLPDIESQESAQG